MEWFRSLLINGLVRRTPKTPRLAPPARAPITSKACTTVEESTYFFRLVSGDKELGVVDLRNFDIGISCRLNDNPKYLSPVKGPVIIRGEDECQQLKSILERDYCLSSDDPKHKRLFNRLHEYRSFARGEASVALAKAAEPKVAENAAPRLLKE